MLDDLVSVAAENLLKMARDEAMLMIGAREELEDLSRKLTRIRAVLQDAEMKQFKKEAVRIWLLNLKFVAYEIEDVLEAWDQVRNSSSSFSCMMHPFRHSKFGHKVKTIKEKLAKIVSEKDDYDLRETVHVRELEGRQTDSSVEQSSVIGRDEDSKMLRRKLMEENLACREGEVPVIAIVGMGGVGKTTLAQVVFNSETIKNHFEKCIWVCISNNFNVKDIMISIVNNGGGSITKDDGIQVELVKNKLLELIENKRYLLVLDDVWNENEREWKKLQQNLNRGANGSRIVVTTRSKRVAIATRSENIQDLCLLPKDECWSIFEKIVFAKSNDGQGYKDLEEVGKQIVEKCSGLPLAVNTIACVVRMKSEGDKPTREQLENILNSEIWGVSIEGILPALMLSYIELPSKLKNCFCYCSLFEKDFVFEKSLLIKLWVAQGYIVANDVQREESIGEEYIKELLHRSLFQEPEVDEHGSITSWKMHDLVHDLAQWVTKTEFSIMKMIPPDNRLMSLGDARHCAILGDLEWKRDIDLTGVENLRTLIYFPEYFVEEINIGRVIKHLQSARVLSLRWVSMSEVHGFKKLVHLRYLDLSDTGIKVLPKSIGKLKELRYLELSDTNIKRLPKTISSLSHLQTLNLSGCQHLRKLPDGIPGMGSLRHLDVSRCSELEKLPDGIGRLTLLQTLNLSGCEHLRKLPDGIHGMGSLRHLDVSLCWELEKLPDGIGRLTLLQTLNLSGCEYLRKLPDGIPGMGSLRHLDVSRCWELEKLPDGIGRLTSLQTLGYFPVVVGVGGRSNIGELGGLNQLCGHLSITKLGAVESDEEARTAKLEDKTSLKELWLWWNDAESPHPAAEGVLESLHPPPTLEELWIADYPGRAFPSWVGDASFLLLRQVKLSYCENCTQLPPLGQLPCLKRLSIEGLSGVKEVGEEFLHLGLGLRLGDDDQRGTSIVAFPQLESLDFENMDHWERWAPPLSSSSSPSSSSIAKKAATADATILPRLSKLSINRCHKLEGVPPIFTTALQTLRISDCPALPSLHFLPPSIQRLEVDGVSTWKLLADCSTALLPALKHLSIEDVSELPPYLLHLTDLQSLRICYSENLRTLPEGLTLLTNLRELTIHDCTPELREGCEVGGLLWPRIAHIPRIVIDFREVQNNAC